MYIARCVIIRAVTENRTVTATAVFGKTVTYRDRSFDFPILKVFQQSFRKRYANKSQIKLIWS